jgi:hypothetical protein
MKGYFALVNLCSGTTREEGGLYFSKSMVCAYDDKHNRKQTRVDSVRITKFIKDVRD